MLNPSQQAASAAPINVRTEPNHRAITYRPPVPFEQWTPISDLRIRIVADRLAHQNDSADNHWLDGYVPGWQDDEPRFDLDDLRAEAERHGANHDGQLHPDDVAYWTMPEDEFQAGLVFEDEGE